MSVRTCGQLIPNELTRLTLCNLYPVWAIAPIFITQAVPRGFRLTLRGKSHVYHRPEAFTGQTLI
jgi:hypothetical protein